MQSRTHAPIRRTALINRTALTNVRRVLRYNSDTFDTTLLPEILSQPRSRLPRRQVRTGPLNQALAITSRATPLNYL